MGSSCLRLGTVPFINARPLTFSLENNENIQIVSFPPSELSSLLKDNKLDGALVSSFSLFRLKNSRYVPKIGIVSNGPVESIRLYCRKPADTLQVVGLDSWSLSASNMLRVLLKHRWGVEPKFVPVNPKIPPKEDNQLDAFLLIGDNALREPPGDFYVVDLGDEWTAFTKLPFVYAVWVFPEGKGNSDIACELIKSKEEGIKNLDKITSVLASENLFIKEGDIRNYLTNCILYDVGEKEEEGLNLYYDYLQKDGLVEKGWIARKLPVPDIRFHKEGAENQKEDLEIFNSSNSQEDEQLCFKSIADVSSMIREKKISPLDLTQSFLKQIEKINSKLNVYVTVTEEEALKKATKAEKEINRGNYRGPLHGIPFAAKDIINTEKILTTNGSNFFKDHYPDKDAFVISSLYDAGAVLLGKVNTHEFAGGSTTINPFYGTTKNPWNTERIVGGSSGGSAAAVASYLTTFSLGTDTGGSIRTPAGFCGVVGLKPTHGRVSLSGVCPNVLSFDHVGPMARSTEDIAIILESMAGYDFQDSKSKDIPVPEYSSTIDQGIKDKRIVICPDFYNHSDVDSAVRENFESACLVFESLGAIVEEIPFPHFEKVMNIFPKIAGPEFSEFHRSFFEKNPKSYGEDILKRLDWSFEISMDEYVRGLREREIFQREMEEFFKTFDALISPALPCVAPTIEGLKANIDKKEIVYDYLHRPFLTPHNVTGFPALVSPTGFDQIGMPTSIQIVSGPWKEESLFQIAHAFEKESSSYRNVIPEIILRENG
tara:strand:- start:7446 stop:9755 length:2310 start_codon:yes stop_codon:yes gene_type:complete